MVEKNKRPYGSGGCQLHAYFNTCLALQAEALEDVAEVFEAKLRVAAEPLVGAAVLLQAVHGLLAAVLVAAHIDHEAVRDGGGQLEGGGRELAGTQRADLAVHKLLKATRAEHAEADVVAPPVGHQVWEVLQAAFLAATLDVAAVGERSHERESHFYLNSLGLFI